MVKHFVTAIGLKYSSRVLKKYSLIGHGYINTPLKVGFSKYTMLFYQPICIPFDRMFWTSYTMEPEKLNKMVSEKCNPLRTGFLLLHLYLKVVRISRIGPDQMNSLRCNTVTFKVVYNDQATSLESKTDPSMRKVFSIKLHKISYIIINGSLKIIKHHVSALQAPIQNGLFPPFPH